jgi:hypothetical protein
MASQFDGAVNFYTLTNTAAKGKKPVLTETLKASCRFEARTLGVARYQAGLQIGVQIAKVIRVPKMAVSPQDIAGVTDFDTGAVTRYIVQRANPIEGELPKMMDVELSREGGDV